MSISEYAKKVRVHKRTIYNDIKAGRIVPSIVIRENGPAFDINTFDYPISSYKRKGKGRPKGSKKLSKSN